MMYLYDAEIEFISMRSIENTEKMLEVRRMAFETVDLSKRALDSWQPLHDLT